MEGFGGVSPIGQEPGDGKNCTRCGLHYETEKHECPHCIGLSVSEAKEYGKSVRDSLAKEAKPIAKLFLYVAIAILLIMVFIVLNE